MWTVEWVAEDGEKRIDNDSSEGRQIRELWGDMVAKRLNAEKGKKRKRESEKQKANQNATVEGGEQQATFNAPEQDSQPLAQDSAAKDEVSAPGDIATHSISAQKPEASVSTGSADYQADTTDPSNGMPDPSEEGGEPAEALAPEFFYLLRPFTASKSIVLTPIDSSRSLTECLKGQTVLEFPTIYVLPDGPDSLSAGFQLSEQYEKVQKAEEAEVDSLVQRTNQSTGGALTATREEEKPLDANSILDMLKRDVGV